MKNNDYSDHFGLWLCYRFQEIGYLTIPGAKRTARFLGGLMPKPNPEGLCIIKTIHGYRAWVDPFTDEGLERKLFSYGTFEEGTLRAMNSILRSDKFFIDIGANIGLMSLHAANILNGTGKVLAFEPLPRNYDILCRNIQLNDFSNIEAVNIALGSEKGNVEIFDNIIHRGAASIIQPRRSGPSYNIPIERLDVDLERRGIRNSDIGCIKIDVEGWELEVLKGAAAVLSGPDAPVCIVEYMTSHATYGGETKDIYNFFRDINAYRIFHLARGRKRPSKLLEIKREEDLPRHDNLLCFLPDHIRRLPGRMFQNDDIDWD